MAPSNLVRAATGRVQLSYVFDWVIVVIFIAIGGALSFVAPVRRPFSLTDNSISFPYHNDTISVSVLFVVAVVVPAIVILMTCLTIVRVPAHGATEPSRGTVWKTKLWELHASWLGLVVSLALSFLLTQSMKNLFGKHRPDFLARCDPDLSNIGAYVVGGFTSEVLEGTSQLVTWQICQSKTGAGVGNAELQDGFRSFPSGHCTISFAGLIYLSLFLAARFSAVVPYLVHSTEESPQRRRSAAAPPLYPLVLVFIPVAVAIYVASTRYKDNKHEGFDILFGSVEGLICAWFAFRWYHLPLRQGSGWAWAPRHPSAAFWPGDYEGWGNQGAEIEHGTATIDSDRIELRDV